MLIRFGSVPFGIGNKIKIASKQDHPRKLLTVYIGLAVIVLFLSLVSIAPQVGERLGELAIQNEKKSALASIADTDSDGFTDAQEEAIGTDPNSPCPVNPSHAAWPPDINNDRVVNDTDANLIADQIGSQAASRYDLNTDGIVNVDDVTVLITPVNYYDQSCAN